MTRLFDYLIISFTLVAIVMTSFDERPKLVMENHFVSFCQTTVVVCVIPSDVTPSIKKPGCPFIVIELTVELSVPAIISEFSLFSMK